MDYEALDLQPFVPGAIVRFQNGFHIISDPFRAPLLAISGLFSPVGTFTDKLRVLALRTKLLSVSLHDLLETKGKSMSVDEYLRDFGFSSTFISSFFRPFYEGIFLAPLKDQSSSMFSFVFRMFAEGRASLPAQGIGAISEQLRAGLPENVRIHLKTKVEKLERGGILSPNGRHGGAAIIVATEGPEAVRLLEGKISTENSRGSICLYFTSDEAGPISKGILALNGEMIGPINNMFVASRVAPSYAPAGKTLISTTIVGDELGRSDWELEEGTRKQMGEWFGKENVKEWKLLRIYRIPHSQTAQSGGLDWKRTSVVDEGVFVCGDHRNSPTVNGALASGEDAAEQVLAYLTMT